MAAGGLWNSLLNTFDPLNNHDVKPVPAVLQSTINQLETDLAFLRAYLDQIQPHASTRSPAHSTHTTPTFSAADEMAAEAINAYRAQLLNRASDPGGHVMRSPMPPTTPYGGPVKPVRQLAPPPHPLLRVLTNSVVMDHLAPYLPVSALLSLASTSTEFRSLIMDTPFVFRHLDLRRCRGAQPFSVDPIDSGGQVWRRERMDESLTEDDFYSGPLRGTFSDLDRRHVLQDVRTLILDGLAVPTDIVTEILTSDRFKVSILSIRECRHLNERKLMQSLQYAVRPTRPKGTPRVKGIYYFTPKDASAPPCATSCESPQAGRRPMHANVADRARSKISALCCSQTFRGRQWYEPSGRVLSPASTNGWAQTLQLCEGIISFDAVLCRSPRHDPDLYTSENPNMPLDPFLHPAIASHAVGPKGCASCNTAPEGPAIWGQSPQEYFPLLASPPTHSSTISDAKCPAVYPKEQPSLILRCDGCIVNRRCYRCKKWWCSSCAPRSASPSSSPTQSGAATPVGSLGAEPTFPNLDVSRDCWECGPTCTECKADVQRTCTSCQGGYCIEHNDGCSPVKCDWCCSTRRTRDLY